MKRFARLYNNTIKDKNIPTTAYTLKQPKKSRTMFFVSLAGLTVATFGGFFYMKHQRAANEQVEKKNWVAQYAQSEIKGDDVKKQLIRQENVIPSVDKTETRVGKSKDLSESAYNGTSYDDVEKKSKEIVSLKSELQKNLGEIVALTRKLNGIQNELQLSTNLSNDLSSKLSVAEKTTDSLKSEISSLEAIAKNKEMKLNNKIASLNQTIQEMIVEEKEKLEVELKNQRAQLTIEFDAKNFDRVQKAADVLGKLYAAQHLLIRNLSYIGKSNDLQKTTMLILSLDDTAKTNAPFLPEFAQLLAAEDDFIRSILQKIPSDCTIKGIETVEELHQEFSKIKKEAISLSYIPNSSGFFGYLYSKILSKLIIQEHGNVSGSSIDAKIARAEFFLQNHDLLNALKELDGIEGASREFLSQWRTKAENRYQVDQTIEILKYHHLNSLDQIN